MGKHSNKCREATHSSFCNQKTLGALGSCDTNKLVNLSEPEVSHLRNKESTNTYLSLMIIERIK